MSDTNTPDQATWADKLLDEQKTAAAHEGSNARMLAGPGTGKTLTLRARVAYLVLEKKVEPREIMALTFTRAAAAELRGRIEKALEGKVADRPRVATLHSFALRTLLRNAKLLDVLPQPLRIADDWEERHIIQEDLKEITGTNIKTVRKNLQALSADWDTLRADESAPNPLKADAAFVGAWEQHRRTYGYTLRSELVYQLKRALEQHGDLKFDNQLKHLLVDEYQDLNACDLKVVSRLVERGCLVYAAGDDDQSIYGFRHANPEGIRRFDKEHAPSKDLNLATCMRCDQAIIDLARFVADLDPARIKKPWQPRTGAGAGEVHLLRFDTGQDEAQGIASLCKFLITNGTPPDEVLILIRSDRSGAFSKPLQSHMAQAGVPFSVNVESDSPLDSAPGRSLLSLLRLSLDDGDSLAWRTLLSVRKNGVGSKTVKDIASDAMQSGSRFGVALRAKALGSGGALRKEFDSLTQLLGDVKALVGASDATFAGQEMQERLGKISQVLSGHGLTDLDQTMAHVSALARESEVVNFAELLSIISMAGLTPEQERTAGAVNMLTMHKAKGLSARAVIVTACEDEYLPGRQQSGGEEADERRLLFVSLTRARERLYIAYAQRRYGPQQHTGRNSGKQKRHLTRYLRNAPVHAEPAGDYLGGLGKI